MNAKTYVVSGEREDKKQLPDVGVLYNQLEDASDEQSILDIRKQAIKLGHTGLLVRTYEKLGYNATDNELYETLKNAVREGRGYSISDPSTCVGMLYQTLFQQDYQGMSFGVKLGESNETRLTYEQLQHMPEPARKILDKIVLGTKKLASVSEREMFILGIEMKTLLERGEEENKNHDIYLGYFGLSGLHAFVRHEEDRLIFYKDVVVLTPPKCTMNGYSEYLKENGKEWSREKRVTGNSNGKIRSIYNKEFGVYTLPPSMTAAKNKM